VLLQVEDWTKDTPLFSIAGAGNNVIKATPNWGRDYTRKEHSYCKMERQLSSLNVEYAKQLEEYCIEYVNEWGALL